MNIKKRVTDRIKYGCDLETFDYLETGLFVPSENEKIRINLIISTIDKKRMFGGLTTAFNFYFELLATLEFDARIIVTDIKVDSIMLNDYPDYRLTNAGEDSSESKQICDYTIANGVRPTISIRKKDIFLSTYWTTMYMANKMRDFQIEKFKLMNPILYLIQDYEPGFYKWSSEFLLIESTYKIKSTYAIINSKNLLSYLNMLGYSFEKEFCFEPRINNVLKEELMQYINNNIKYDRKQQVIIYGRPFNGRNCFSLIVAALKVLLEQHKEARHWEYLSIGGNHKNIELVYGKKLICIGKLSLKNYAKILTESKVGVSLMCSPHPSYPPLEMSSFGVNTITNTYSCKDLKKFNNNISSIDEISIQNLADFIWDNMCKNDGNIDIESPYISDTNQFDFINKSIKELLSQ